MPLRRAYPSVVGVDRPRRPRRRPRYVVDGLALARDALLGWIGRPSAAPRGRCRRLGAASLHGNPGDDAGRCSRTSEPELVGVLAAIDRIADALDAVGDLVVAEACTSSRVAITRAPRRRCPHWRRDGRRPGPRSSTRRGPGCREPSAPPPAPGGRRRRSPPCRLRAHRLDRARGARTGGEPLARWPAGRPAEIRGARRALAPGRRGDRAVAGVAVADLGLQPIDLLAILGRRARDGRRRAPRGFSTPCARPTSPTTQAPARCARTRGRPPWTAEVRSLTEIAPLLEAAAELVRRGRPRPRADYAARVHREGGTAVDRPGRAGGPCHGGGRRPAAPWVRCSPC